MNNTCDFPCHNDHSYHHIHCNDMKTKPEPNKKHDPLCKINMSCTVDHGGAPCPGPYGICDCKLSPQLQGEGGKCEISPLCENGYQHKGACENYPIPPCPHQRLHTEKAPYGKNGKIETYYIETYCADCGLFIKKVEIKYE